MAAFLTPWTVPFCTSAGVSISDGSIPWSGCEQHVLVHTLASRWDDVCDACDACDDEISNCR